VELEEERLAAQLAMPEPAPVEPQGAAVPA